MIEELLANCIKENVRRKSKLTSLFRLLHSYKSLFGRKTGSTDFIRAATW